MYDSNVLKSILKIRNYLVVLIHLSISMFYNISRNGYRQSSSQNKIIFAPKKEKMNKKKRKTKNCIKRVNDYLE